MDWFDKLIVFLACIVEVFIFFDYFHNFFDIKVKKIYVKLICIGTVLIFFGINMLQSSIINLIFVPILLWIFVTILFDAKLSVRFGYFVLAYVIMIGIEFLYIMLSEVTTEVLDGKGCVKLSEHIWQLLFIKFLNYIVFSILKQTSIKGKNRITNKLFLIWICVPIATKGIMFTVFYSDMNVSESSNVKVFMTIFFVCMLLGNILFFYAFQKYTENLEDIYWKQVKLSSQEVEIARLMKVAEMNAEFSETLHNTVHYLKVIRELAYEKKNQEICDIVEKLSGKLNRETIYEYSHHKMLNTILSEYNSKAKKAGIHFDVYVEPGCVLEQIQDVDLITMLGNILDNAITATIQKENEPSIMVRIFMQKNGKLCIIKVVNGFTGKLKEENGKLLSTKKEAGIHGLGVSSVSKIAEQYGGYLEYYVEDFKFHAILVLPVPHMK